ncbi:hypothetical protein PanWU01x14_357990 [Parasponia andersonii]|uniref:Uncharacterized protein n=1 Tax=Parasponia andersonii TaxID=3476 RepID=A0A2P5A8F6_PARAD|nr:hypothetical protein PanWU01x14_357990 [Parasponia andersonii]
MNLDLNLVDIGFKDQMPEGVNKKYGFETGAVDGGGATASAVCGAARKWSRGGASGREVGSWSSGVWANLSVREWRSEE